MGFISDVARAAVKTVTAPLRFVGNVARMAGNVLQIAGSLLTGDLKGAKKNLGELWKATKGAVFSGVETAFLAVGGIAAIGAKATLGAAGVSMGGQIVAGAAGKTALKNVGGAFVTAYAENKMR